MEELIFFAVIIFFSIIESIARGRKARKAQREADGGGEAPAGRPEHQFEWAQKSPDELPTYDADPSYDDLATREPEPAGPPTRDERPSSSTLLSGRLLEELAGIANRVEEERRRMLEAEIGEGEESGAEALEEQVSEDWAEEQRRRREAQRRAREAERRSDRGSGRSMPVPVPSRVPAPSRARAIGSRPEHYVHLAHAEYGTDPSERSRSAQDGLDPLAERLSEDAKAARRQLRSGSPGALRRALILQEVLGPPAALRDDPFEDR